MFSVFQDGQDRGQGRDEDEAQEGCRAERRYVQCPTKWTELIEFPSPNQASAMLNKSALVWLEINPLFIERINLVLADNAWIHGESQTFRSTM